MPGEGINASEFRTRKPCISMLCPRNACQVRSSSVSGMRICERFRIIEA